MPDHAKLKYNYLFIHYKTIYLGINVTNGKSSTTYLRSL